MKKNMICDGFAPEGLRPMTKSEIKIFDDYDKRVAKGEEISYSFEPFDLMMKLSVHVEKDKRGNITVDIRQPKKGECHHHNCHNKSIKNYSICRKHKK